MPIPDDFRLTDEMRGFALTLGVTEAEAVAEFGKMVAFAEANDLRGTGRATGDGGSSRA